jgi:hypothetical protein
MRIRKALATGLLALTPALSGCLVHRHSVLRSRPPEIVYGASLDVLLKQVDQRYEAVNAMTASVQVVACTGGTSKGQVTCYTSVSGYIILEKPEQIRVLLLLPVLKSKFLDMVSDGNTFKMVIPPENCAIVGSDVLTNTSQKGLYALRPAVILDSLLIQPREDDQVVAMTQDSRTLPDPKRAKGVIEEPDYDIQFLSRPTGLVAQSLRVIHIGRATLLPYRQDIYNAEGKVATQAFYSNYQKFGDVSFPSKIEIQRPLDELSLTITLDKKTNFNQKLAEGTFDLDPIPATYTVQNMDDPKSAATNPCAAHAPKSKR